MRHHACDHETAETTERQHLVSDALDAMELAIDEYYNGTKDAPFEGSVAYVYRAMKALERNEEFVNEAISILLQKETLDENEITSLWTKFGQSSRSSSPPRSVEVIPPHTAMFS